MADRLPWAHNSLLEIEFQPSLACSKVDPKLQTTSDTRARDATKGASLSTVGRLTLNAELLALASVIAGKLPGPLASRYSLNFNP